MAYGRWYSIRHGPFSHQPSALSHVVAVLRFWCGAAFCVEALDHVRREVETRRGPRDAGLSRVEYEVESLLRGERIDDRRQLLHEVVLHFLLQLVDLRLSVLLEALGVLLLPLDFLLELRPCRLVHHAAAGLELLLVRLQLLGLFAVLVLLLLDERLDARERGLPLHRVLERDLGLEEGDLGTGRERRWRLRRWCRCGGYDRLRRRRHRRLRRLRLRGRRLLRGLRLLRGRLREHGGGAQRTGERRGNDRTFHPSESFRVYRKSLILHH